MCLQLIYTDMYTVYSIVSCAHIAWHIDPASPRVYHLYLLYKGGGAEGVIGICGLFSNVSMLVSIDIAFYGPQILIPYIMIVEAPL
jgi:hypothetical protein